MMSKLALHGGTPVRKTLLPYGRQIIDKDDIKSVSATLSSEYLTTGPAIDQFEKAFSDYTHSREAVAVSSGTAALHAAVNAVGITAGDEVIVPAITFAATANSVVYQGGKPVFADVDPDTLLINPDQVDQLTTPRTKAILCMDYAGQPCDFSALREIAEKSSCFLIDDACHALGARNHGKPVGSLGDLSTFSFHPVKNMTTGEGGMVTTDNSVWAQKIRQFRNHGISLEYSRRALKNTWYYEMEFLGYNYRMTDIQAALGVSQLRKLDRLVAQRRSIASLYDQSFEDLAGISPLKNRDQTDHARHLYVVKLELNHLQSDRSTIFKALRAEGIGVNVHYIPVYYHPFYRQKFGLEPGICPVAEAAYERILTLPLFAGMTQCDVDDVIEAVKKVLKAFYK